MPGLYVPAGGPKKRSRLTGEARFDGAIDQVDRFAAAARELTGWIQSGEPVYRVDVQQGFEKIPATLPRLFTGQNRAGSC